MVGHDSPEMSLIYTHAEMVEKEVAQQKLLTRLSEAKPPAYML
jgi:hypothetical protein